MKVRYTALALILAACLATPAFAGVTGTAGGSKTRDSRTDKVVDGTGARSEYSSQYDVYTNGSSRVTKTNTNTSYDVGTVINGSATWHEWVGVKWGGWRDSNVDSAYWSSSVAASDPSVQSAISSMKSSLKNSLQNISGRTGGGCGYSSSVSKSTNSSSKVTSSSTAKNGTYTDKTGSHVGTTYQEEVFRENTYSTEYNASDDLIAIGDLDNWSNLQIAQGSLNRTDVTTEHYDLVDVTVYGNDYVTGDTLTKTNNVTVTNQTVYSVNVTRTVSPIVLDLDGDGKIEASEGNYLPHLDKFVDSRLAMFDFYGNGFPVMTEWVGKNDGLLCRASKDGSVNGTQLFGSINGFDNGYDELASLDVNKSGDLEGAELNGLMVWVDANGNGQADKGELTSVQDMGISSIGVKHNELKGSFVMNGKTQVSVDWWPNIKECRKIDVAKR